MMLALLEVLRIVHGEDRERHRHCEGAPVGGGGVQIGAARDVVDLGVPAAHPDLARRRSSGRDRCPEPAVRLPRVVVGVREG